jgi:DNA-binding IclR family transcriptional regulator
MTDPGGPRAVGRALDILACFREDVPGLTSTEIARRLGPSVVELGLLAYRQRGLARVTPELEHLQRITAATADLALRSGDKAMIVAGGSLRPELGVGLCCPLHSTALGKVLLAWDGPGLSVAELGPLRPLTDWTIVDPDVLQAEISRVRKAGYAVNDGESAGGRAFDGRARARPVADGAVRAGRPRDARRQRESRS